MLCLAQIFIGLNIVSAKPLVAHISISLIIFLRFGFCSILLYALCRILGKPLNRDSYGNKLALQDIFMVALQGLCGGVLFNFLMLNGLLYTDATTAGIISSTTPAMIALLSLWLLKEKLSTRKITTIIFAVLGIICLHLNELNDSNVASSLLGNILVMASVIPEAMFTIIAKLQRTPIPALVAAAISNIANALFCFPIALSVLPDFRATSTPWTTWLLIGAQVISGVVFYVCWYKGLTETPDSTAALTTGLAPISITLLAFFFLHENLSLLGGLGMLLVLIYIAYDAGITPKFLFKKT